MARRVLNRFSRGEFGTSTIEMAFVFPMLALFILGIMQVGLYQFGHHSAQSALDKTARRIVVMDRPSTSEVSGVLSGVIESPIVGAYSQPRITEVSKHGETFARIELDYNYTLPLPFIKPIQFKSTATSEARLRDMPAGTTP